MKTKIQTSKAKFILEKTSGIYKQYDDENYFVISFDGVNIIKGELFILIADKEEALKAIAQRKKNCSELSAAHVIDCLENWFSDRSLIYKNETYLKII